MSSNCRYDVVLLNHLCVFAKHSFTLFHLITSVCKGRNEKAQAVIIFAVDCFGKERVGNTETTMCFTPFAA